MFMFAVFLPYAIGPSKTLTLCYRERQLRLRNNQSKVVPFYTQCNNPKAGNISEGEAIQTAIQPGDGLW